MWKYTKWSNKIKWSITAFFAVLFIISLGNSGNKQQLATPASVPPTPQPAVTQEQPKVPAKQYEKINTDTVQGVRAYTHYRYTGDAKPTVEDVKKYMVEIVKLGCDGPKVCNFFLWDSKDAYVAGKDSVTSGMASEVATKNKDHLVGYINSGYAFYYYGATGNGSGSITILDPSANTYIDF